MTTAQEPAAAPEPGLPPAANGGGMGDLVDVRSLAAQRPAEAVWLQVTEIDGPAGAVFTAHVVPGPQPRGFGGDVLLHLPPGTSPQPRGAISVAAWTVAAGVAIPVAAWELPDDGGWPERVRATVAFAMSTMTELGEHLSLGELEPVDLDAATALAKPGLPWPLPAASQAATAR